ncbi:MAG TPA: DUF4173 domain-containing protein [Thermoanaerobaculia bacterium]|jgi:hypothetical protein
MTAHALALRIAAAALALGVVWDGMVRYVPWGVNVVVWTGMFVAAGIWCRVSGIRGVTADETGSASPPAPDTRHLTPDTLFDTLFPAASALLASLGLLWRDSGSLVALDILLLLVFLPMLGLGARGVRLQAAGVGAIALGWLVTAVQAVAGLVLLVTRELKLPAARPSSGRLRVVVRGTLLAAPALLVFGALLTSADAKFELLVQNLFTFRLEELFAHLAVIAIVTAVCAGYLRAFAYEDELVALARRPPTLRLAVAETTFALGLVNLLFAMFVGVQFRYFFGAPPATLSAYARRGFFELVFLVALVVPMLLLLDWLVDDERVRPLFRIMVFAQIGLVLIIAASAYYRMHLYRAEFGLTTQRLFTTAVMLWLAFVLVWLAATVLTGRRERFAIGALAAGVATVVILHAINPDALIVRTNLARAGDRPFDANYALQLSDDAAEVILTDPRIPPETAIRFAKRQRTIGWRTWNVSRGRAIALIRAGGYESKAMPPIRPGRLPGSTRESSSSRRLEISRKR